MRTTAPRTRVRIAVVFSRPTRGPATGDASAGMELLESRTLLCAGHEIEMKRPSPPQDITVMSQNLYLGADLAPVIGASSVDELLQAVTTTWANVQKTDFPERAEAIADEIVAAKPDLIGLQEASLWRIQPQGDTFSANPTPATQVVYDFVKILTDALARHRLHYAVAAETTEFDVELPDSTEQDIRLTDRDVILTRVGKGADKFKLTNVQEENFSVNLPVPMLGGQFTSLRGWASVDVESHGKAFRFVSAHLEETLPPGYPDFQGAQAAELLATAGNTKLPTILVGDYNSDATVPQSTYSSLLAAGLHDAWTATNPGDAGLTWGQSATLDNTSSTLSQRLDLVMVRGNLRPDSMHIVGDELSDRTHSGLWPSDHAGVVATLDLSKPQKPIHQACVSGFAGVFRSPDGGFDKMTARSDSVADLVRS